MHLVGCKPSISFTFCEVDDLKPKRLEIAKDIDMIF